MMRINVKMNAFRELVKSMVMYVSDIYWEIYIKFIASDFKHLKKLCAKKEEFLWSYFLAQDLFRYRVSKLNSIQRHQMLQRIDILWLSHQAITSSTRRRSRNYVKKLGIPVSEIEIVELVQPSFSRTQRKCEQCVYFHGQSYKGQFFVCAVHPFGLSDCLDFKSLDLNF